MSLTKSRDLWGFDAGIVSICTVFFYGSSWIGSVSSINKYFNVGCMTLYCHCISKIHHSPSLTDTHSARIFDIYSCWGNTVRLRKQKRRVMLWLSLQNLLVHLTLLLQKSVNRLSWGVAEIPPPPRHPLPPPYLNSFLMPLTGCASVVADREIITSLVESILNNYFQNVTTWHVQGY